MSLSFNFDSKFTVPRVPHEKYKYTSLLPLYSIGMSNDAGIITINVQKQVTDAWQYLENNCAKSADCNKYFATLSRKKTLAECMKDNFVIHRLQPKTNNRTGKIYPEEDLPGANGAGLDIGLSLYTFIDTQNETARLAAVLLHEIAHYAGATTDISAPNALDAEHALIPCGLKHYYLDYNKG